MLRCNACREPLDREFVGLSRCEHVFCLSHGGTITACPSCGVADAGPLIQDLSQFNPSINLHMKVRLFIHRAPARTDACKLTS